MFACLYKGEYIGVETLYTVVDGAQINIPERLAFFRKAGKDKELFCPCGCGDNVTLVAGPSNLRQQHFRHSRDFVGNCTINTESEMSISCKSALKIWLEKSLDTEVATRVSVNMFNDEKRRYEYTILALAEKVGIMFVYEGTNIDAEKIEILDNHKGDISVIYISSIVNLNDSGQYPEHLAKMENKQGYCLLLKTKERKDDCYNNAQMTALYTSKCNGIYKHRILVDSGNLQDFSVDKSGRIAYNGRYIDELKIEMETKIREVNERRQKELERIAEERRLQREQMMQEFEKRRKEQEEERKREEEIRIKKNEKKEKEKERENRIKSALEEVKIREKEYYICHFCNRTLPAEEMSYCDAYSENGEFIIKYGYGHCRTCYSEMYKKRKKETCPRCGATLELRYGGKGLFWGCSNYPICKYTASK